MHYFLKFIFGIKLYMFRTVPLSIIRSFSLYTQQWYMSYRFCWLLAWQADIGFADCLPSKQSAKPVRVWHTPLLCVQWKTPDDGQRNCPKHVEFYSKNKFEKLMHLVGFIISMYVCIYICIYVCNYRLWLLWQNLMKGKERHYHPSVELCKISQRSLPLFPIPFNVNWPRDEPRPPRQNVEFLTFI